MADNVAVTPGSGATVATDDIAGVQHPRVKIEVGADGAAQDVQPPDADSKTTGLLPAGVMVYSPTGAWWNRLRQAEQDGLAHTGVPAFLPMLWNGTNLDRLRGPMEGTLLASAARTAAATSPTQTNTSHRGVLVNVNVTVAGTGGLQFAMHAIDPITSNQTRIMDTISAPITTAVPRNWGFELSPGANELNLSAAGFGILKRTGGTLPRKWAVTIFPTDASSWTYSVSYMLLV